MTDLCSRRSRRPPGTVAVVVAFAVLLVLPPVVDADPPPWAPAWGYRAKQDRQGHGHGHGHGNQRKVRNDDDIPPDVGGHIGIPDGSCHRERLGALAGGALGGLIGSRIGDGDGQTVAVIAGTLIGLFVGSQIGRHMDELDERCIGQTLERAPDGQVVTWRNEHTGTRFEAEPVRTFRRDGRYCRDYLARMESSGDSRRLDGTACRHDDGVWHVL